MIDTDSGARALIPRLIRRLSVPILLFWLALAAAVNVLVPQLEVVGQERSVSLSPADAASTQATSRVGMVFQEFSSDSSAMIVLEGDQPLGDAAHRYYGALIDKLNADKQHVEHVQDFWSDPLTAASSQSADGKAAYVQLYLAGNQGESLANESVAAVRNIVANSPPPPGIDVYVTGPAPLVHDVSEAGSESLELITLVTVGMILLMLLLVYRKVTTALLMLVMMLVSLASTRGVVAALGHYGFLGLSTFATNLLTMVAIAVSTDYAIFLVGRYQEARSSGEDRETAFYTMYHSTAHVILGSGLTIAGATFCLYFTHLPYFQTMGVPMAIGMVVAVVAALTMAPAVLTIASRFGLFEPRRTIRTRGWRRVGTAVVRWPGPILIASLAVALVGLLALPSFKVSYDDRKYQPADTPANEGFATADRHFPQARMNPDLMLIETDHDLRNPADMLVIDRIAKAIFHLRGVGRVQTITRPLGTPIENTSIPFQISMQGTAQQMNQDYMENVTANILKQANDMQATIDSIEQMQSVTEQMAATMHSMVEKMKNMTLDVAELRDNIADFDDFFRPLRNYFYWEPHCFDIPICWSIRSLFDSLDGIDTMTDDIQDLMPDMERLDSLMPQLVAIMPSMIETMKNLKNITLTMYQSQKSQQDQTKAMQDNVSSMGAAFDASKNDDSFYLPPEVFENPEFQRGLKMFVSPDGKAVRFIISHELNPDSPESLELVPEIKNVAFDAMKGTPWEGSRIYLGGTAATYKDLQDGWHLDLLITGIAALCLIFIVMLLITRGVVAAGVIVGTVVLSLGASLGMSVLFWQYIVGLELSWVVMAIALIILLAVGSDYNLLLVARIKNEIRAGVNTGLIRAMAGSGAVVTAAGLVFAFTMMGMIVSDLRAVGQMGTMIGLGLLFDTFVVRSFMTPSIAALLGRWFWWPQLVRPRPVPKPWPKPPRHSTETVSVGTGSPPDDNPASRL